MNKRPQNPKLPEGTFAIAPEDKPKIRDFGRKLTGFINSYVKETGAKSFPVKIVAGGFQYYMDILSQKAAMLGDNIVLSNKVSEENGLGDNVIEPFEDTPVVDAGINPSAGKDVPGPTPAPVPAPVAPALPETPATPGLPEATPEAPASDVDKDPVNTVAPVEDQTEKKTPDAPEAPAEAPVPAA